MTEALLHMNPWLLLKYHVYPSRLTMDPDDILPLRKVSLRVAPNQRKLCFKSIGGPPGWIDGLGLDEVIPNAKDRYFVLSSILLEFNYIVSWFAYPDPKDKMKFRLHTFSSLVAATCKRWSRANMCCMTQAY